MAWVGIEPATLRFSVVCSYQLSYQANKDFASSCLLVRMAYKLICILHWGSLRHLHVLGARELQHQVRIGLELFPLFLIVRRHLGYLPRNYQCVVEGFLNSRPLLLGFKLFTSPTCDCPDRGQGGN